jgi:hypothetical protein
MTVYQVRIYRIDPTEEPAIIEQDAPSRRYIRGWAASRTVLYNKTKWHGGGFVRWAVFEWSGSLGCWVRFAGNVAGQ